MSKIYSNNNKKDKTENKKSSTIKGATTNYDLIKAIEKLPRKTWNGISGVSVTQSQSLEALAKCLFHGQDIYDPRNLVFPSLDKIAKLLRVEISTAKRRMKSLREAGWIYKRECGEIKQTSNQYFFSKAIFIVAEAFHLEDQAKAKELAHEAKNLLEKNSLENKQGGELNGSLGLAAKEIKVVFEELLQVNIEQDPAQVIDLVALIQQKHKTLEQQRIEVKNATPGVVKKLPAQWEKRHPRGSKTATLNTHIKSPEEIPKINKSTSGNDQEEEEFKNNFDSFTEATGIKITGKAKEQLEKNRLENGLTHEQVAKNVKKIIESPALRVTTNSIARAGHQSSLLAFGEREAIAKFKRAAQAGELNKTLGHKFKNEHEAVKTVFPEVIAVRAKELDTYGKDPIEWAQKYLESLTDKEFFERLHKYEGEEYRAWKMAQGFATLQSDSPLAQTGTEAQTLVAQAPQPKIDWSDLPDLPF